MNQLDTYYKALYEYRKITEQSRECEKNRKDLADADIKIEKIVVSRNVCYIDENWISEIEKGLIYIEKAIKEERQFIYSNGEVVPVEKVKHVSKETVSHLAKHSNYINRIGDNDDIIPDKLYTVERLNDYAVYENRFLYMLLCYLRDFVTVRYNKLLECVNKYEGCLRIDKSFTTTKRKLAFKVSLDEEHLDDEYIRENNEAKVFIDRIDIILKTIVAFLATPLMEHASKTAMLKPPITKTNVLKMDNNFKGAVALYDFIISYDKDGFSCEKKTTELSPFKNDLSADIAETEILLSFLTYQYGLGIKEELKIRHETEETKEKYEELKKRASKLEALKRRAKNSDKDLEEYTLELEKYAKSLELEAAKSEMMSAEIGKLKENEALMTKKAESQRSDIERLSNDILAKEQQFSESLSLIKSAKDNEISELHASHAKEIQSLNDLNNAVIEDLKKKHEESESDINSRLVDKTAELNEANFKIEELIAIQERLTEEKRLVDAQMRAMRIKNSNIPPEESLTDKESFDELEREFTAFKKFYNDQWRQTKKQIRKNSFKWENLKKQSKND